MIQELGFKGKGQGKSCAICKLTFKVGDTILACPTCQVLFHENHFVEWIAINNKCPVCEHDFSAVIKNYSIRREVDSRPVVHQDLRITNHELWKKPKGILVFGVIFGIIFTSMAVVLFNLLLPFPYVLILTIFAYSLFISGIILIVKSISHYRDVRDNPWEEMIFSENSIRISKFNFPTRELYAEDIDSLTIIQDEHNKMKGGRLYNVSLEIKTIKNQKHCYEKIYSTIDPSDRERFCDKLNRITKTQYHIEIKQVSVYDSLLQVNKKLLLLSGIAYLALSAAVIAINYFFIRFNLI